MCCNRTVVLCYLDHSLTLSNPHSFTTSLLHPIFSPLLSSSHTLNSSPLNSLIPSSPHPSFMQPAASPLTPHLLPSHSSSSQVHIPTFTCLTHIPPSHPLPHTLSLTSHPHTLSLTSYPHPSPPFAYLIPSHLPLAHSPSFTLPLFPSPAFSRGREALCKTGSRRSQTHPRGTGEASHTEGIYGHPLQLWPLAVQLIV